MSAVRIIGEGYYAIETEGVSLDRDVVVRIDRAFKDAAAVPSNKLNIRTPTGSGNRIVELGKTTK